MRVYDPFQPLPGSIITPTITLTPSPVLLSWAEGGIWLHENKEGNTFYEVIDPITGDLHRVFGGEGCEQGPLSYTATVICQLATKHFLLNLETGERRELKPQHEFDAWRSSPDGSFLMYIDTQWVDRPHEYIRYNLADDTEVVLAKGITDYYSSLPALSIQARYLATIRRSITWEGTVFEVKDGKADYRQISHDTPLLTGELSWSPTDFKLLFAASDIIREIGTYPNYLFVTDFETGVTELLAKAPGTSNYQSEFSILPIWSPDGKKIAIPLENQDVCIINVDARTQDCVFVTTDYINQLSWSPDSSKVALSVDDGQQGSLHIFDVSTRQVTEIMSGKRIDVLFWR